MKIPINFRSAEILTQSLCITITDCVCEAGCDAEVTVEKLHQATTFAHELARFLDNISQAVRGEVVVDDDDCDEQRELRVAVAGRSATVTPLHAELAAWTPEGAA